MPCHTILCPSIPTTRTDCRPNAFQLLSAGMKMFVRPSCLTKKKTQEKSNKIKRNFKVGGENTANGWHSAKVAQLVAPSLVTRENHNTRKIVEPTFK